MYVCMYVCICMYIRIYMFVYVCMYVCIYVCICTMCMLASKFPTFRAKNEGRSGQQSYVIDFGRCALLPNQLASPG